MKRFLILFAAAAFVGSCKKSDTCTQDGFIGTWKGKEKCSISGDSDVSIVITKSGSDLSVTGDGVFSTIKATLDDCDFEGGVTVLGVGEKLTGTLSGTTLTMTHKIAETCTYSLTK